LPHKHPHELLDSVVKEQLVKLFVSTEAAHSTAAFLSVKLFFEEFFLSTQPLAPSIRTSSLQREAHSTAFKTAVNHLFQPPSIHSNEAPTGSNHHPVDRRAFYTPDSALQALHLT
ncbi:hypothetical protein, partial [Ectopseudomonas guguanensis]|uniref:hypothetical protein n=1 Tax=Ectopseudomonas guguanensis TaxID=1198456 RepID=UPI00286369DE